MKLQQALHLGYKGVAITLGTLVVTFSLYTVFANAINYQWLILAYLTILTGAFTIRLAGLKSMLSVADTFVFINTILFGTGAGALTAALDGLLASLRLETAARKWRTAPLNTSIMALSAFASGQVFFAALGHGPIAGASSVTLQQLALPAALAAVVYFLCNSSLVALGIAFRTGNNLFGIWRRNFLKALPVFLASGAAGALVAFGMRSITPLMLLVVVPLLVSAYFLQKLYLESQSLPVDSPVDGPVAHRPAYRRFHYFMVVLGCLFITLLVQDIFKDRIGFQWLVLAALAVAAGSITIKIPGIKIKFSLADTFVFANLILFGPVIGGLTAALDGFGGSLRCKTKGRKLEFMLFNIASMALSAYAVGEVFFWILGQGPLYIKPVPATARFFLPAMLLAVSYYILNATGVALIVALQEKLSLLRIWTNNLVWGLAVSTASSLAGVFVATSILTITPTIATAILLIMALIYLTLKATTQDVPQAAAPRL
jgi:hypothetical protein